MQEISPDDPLLLIQSNQADKFLAQQISALTKHYNNSLETIENAINMQTDNQIMLVQYIDILERRLTKLEQQVVVLQNEVDQLSIKDMILR